MATYTPEQVGIKAPSGGFQTGGWYSARQYWNGTLSEPGVIHPSSNQPGAGQTVNPAVVAASNTTQGLAAGTNEAYIAAQRAKTINQEPTTKDQVAPYLSNVQNEMFNVSTSPEVKIPTMEELKSELAPTTTKPEVLNRVGEFEKLRTTYGVADLEKSLTDLKAQQDELYATLRQQKATEQGKPVAMNVISGRMTEEERQYNEQADYLGRQVARVTDELNTKYNVINAYMNFMGLDYQDAVAAYDKEFSQNLQLYDLIAGARKEARSAYEYDQTAAKANLQIYANAVMSGNANYDSLSADQKLMISKLEVQSGMPVGFISNLKISPKDKILGFNDDKTQAWVIGEDGNMKIISTGLTPSATSTTDVKQTRIRFNELVAQGKSFPDLVEEFANTMSLEEIYQAYNNSTAGKAYGKPTEDAKVIQVVYKIAKGELTETQGKLELGIK